MTPPRTVQVIGGQPLYLDPKAWFAVAAVALALYVIVRTAGGMRYFR